MTTSAAARPTQRKTTLTMAGGALIAVTLFMAIGAINGQNNLLYALFGIAIGTVVATGVIGGSSVMRLSVVRTPVTAVPLGQPGQLTYRVSNRNRLLPAFGVVVRESAAAAFANRPAACAVAVWPGQTVTVRAPAWADRRGTRALRDIEVTSAFPFYLVRKTLQFVQPATYEVLPAHLDVPDGVLPRLASSNPRDGTSSRRPGSHGGFLGVREYQPGDPLRRMAWKAAARTGEPVVRVLEDRESKRFVLAVDDDETDQASARSERTAAVAWAVARAALGAGYSIRLAVGSGVHTVPTGRAGVGMSGSRLAGPLEPTGTVPIEPGDVACVVTRRGSSEPGVLAVNPDEVVDSVASAGGPVPAPLDDDWHAGRAAMLREPARGWRAVRDALRNLEWR